jgi:hypothetical protein
MPILNAAPEVFVYGQVLLKRAVSTRELCEESGFTHDFVLTILRKLEKDGRVKKVVDGQLVLDPILESWEPNLTHF